MERYIRNIETLSPEENASLRTKKIAVVGCGGLGGYVLEQLGRIGIGFITAIDGDTFAESNLNRQLLCHNENIGKNKAQSAKERLTLINPDVQVAALDQWLTKDNIDCLTNHDVVVDCLDNIPSRLILAQACRDLGIPLVHGAIAGWFGQVATILPGERTMEKIYHKDRQRGVETRLGNPSFTPALVASIQVSEVIKLLIGRGDLLSGGDILFIDTLHQEYTRASI